MPYTGPHFFRRRQTADSMLAAHPNDNFTHQNKLKKKPPFLSTKCSPISVHLSKFIMGNRTSKAEPAAKPARPPRPSPTELPSLPSQPIYKTFPHRPATLVSTTPKPAIPEKSPSRRSSISQGPWPLPLPEPSITRGRSSSRSRIPSFPPQKRRSSTSDAVPRYDRASQLADSYRALLDSPPCSPPPQRHDSPRRLHHLGNRPLHHSPALSHTPPSPSIHNPQPYNSPSQTPTIRPVLPSLSLPPWSLRPSSATSSSTAIDSPSPVSSGPNSNSSSWQEPYGRNRRWSISSDTAPKLQSRRQQRTSDDVGMQICLSMLSDELKKGLGRSQQLGGNKEENENGVDRLQVLLLIEAYEGVLDGCRKELGRPPRTRGDEGRRKRVKELGRVVDLWLDALYGVYEEGLGVGMI